MEQNIIKLNSLNTNNLDTTISESDKEFFEVVNNDPIYMELNRRLNNEYRHIGRLNLQQVELDICIENATDEEYKKFVQSTLRQTQEDLYKHMKIAYKIKKAMDNHFDALITENLDLIDDKDE